MSVITAKPASHCRLAIALVSNAIVISTVAKVTEKLSCTTASAHGCVVGDIVYVVFATLYTSKLYTCLTGTTASTLIIAGTWSATTTGTMTKAKLLPCHTPVMSLEGTPVLYDPDRNSRHAAPSGKTLIHNVFSHKMPLYLPRDAGEVTDITALLDCILLPAGFGKTAITTGGGDECTGFAYRHADDTHSYDKAHIAYEEVTDREGAADCATSFGLNFSVEGGCWIDPIETKGKHLTIDVGVTAMGYPDLDALPPVLQNCYFKLGAYGSAYPSDYLALRSFVFKDGNEVGIRGDGGSENAVAGVMIGGSLANRTVELELEMPAVHTSFPWQTYLKETQLLKFQMTLLGLATGTFGARINGVFEVRNKIDRGVNGPVRTIKISGPVIEQLAAAPAEPFEILLGAGFTV